MSAFIKWMSITLLTSLLVACGVDNAVDERTHSSSDHMDHSHGVTDLVVTPPIEYYEALLNERLIS